MTVTSSASALSAETPLMDLRTNQIDLGLAPDKPGAGDRALALGEKLLAYCASAARGEYGERLMAVALLSADEMHARGPLAADPDAPSEVLKMLEEQGGAQPGAGLDSRRLTYRWLNRRATQRFTRLMAATHGQAPGAARSKRFAGVVDVYVGNGYQFKPRATGLMLLGEEAPADPALAERLSDPDTVALDTPEARREWLGALSNWNHRREYGKHIQANVLLQQLAALALRVYLRRQGIQDGAPDDELGLLLGSTLMLRVSLKAGMLKGYRLEIAIDKSGMLSVKTPKSAQSIGSLDAQRGAVDALGRGAVEYPGLPLLECQALAPQHRRDATRFCSDMNFFYAVPLGANSTRDRRLKTWTEKCGRDKAEEKERKHRKALLQSGLVIKNRAQDLVERCLDEALGEGAVTPRRFQPKEGRRVPVRSEDKKADTLPAFLREGLPGLQVVYGENLPESAERRELHAALARALLRHGVFGHDADRLPEQRIRVCQNLAQTRASDDPVLVVQVPTAERTSRGAKVATSGWVALGGDAPRPLTGNATAHALAAREYAGEHKMDVQADAYTQAKLTLYDSGRDGWRALQGLNLSSADMDQLMADKEPGELYHKLATISFELKYKYRLQQGEDFPLSGAWRALSRQQPDESGAGQRFICLYGHSPKGAPARAAALEYALSDNTLQVLRWATGTCRLPRWERTTLSAAAANRTQLYKAYCAALENWPQSSAVGLEAMLEGMVEGHRSLNDALLVYSPAAHQLLVEQPRFGSAELLGATWRGFPFTDILRDGPHQDGKKRRNLARSTVRGSLAVAAQLTPLPHQYDVLLEPAGAQVHGIRAMRNAQGTEKRNNPLISWQVFEPQGLGNIRLQAVEAPHQQPVFHSFIETLTDNLIKQGRISRTPLPGKLVKLLVRN